MHSYDDLHDLLKAIQKEIESARKEVGDIKEGLNEKIEIVNISPTGQLSTQRPQGNSPAIQDVLVKMGNIEKALSDLLANILYGKIKIPIVFFPEQ